MDKQRLLLKAGSLVLLFIIFGVPAILVPVSMDNVPERSRLKVATLYQRSIDTVQDTFERHNTPATVPGRLEPLPTSSMAWIKLINPMGRKAPGGGQALLPEADDLTGAIGLTGDAESVTITLPAYAGLERTRILITGSSPEPRLLNDPAVDP